MRPRRLPASLTAVLMAAVTVAPGQSGAQSGAATVIKAARMLDVKAGTYRTKYALLVVDGRIAHAGPAPEVESRAPAGARTIDLGAATMLPGLIDCHAHLLALMEGRFGPGADIIIAVTQLGQARRALIGAGNAREMLEAGFTTARNVGHSGVDGDVALREAVDGGTVAGPRVLASGRKVTPPGGQAVALRNRDQSARGGSPMSSRWMAIRSPTSVRSAG